MTAAIKLIAQRDPCEPETTADCEWVIEIAALRAVGDARALVEGELADLIPQTSVEATGLLTVELVARAARAGLLPVRLTVRRNDAGVEVGVRWRSGPDYLSAVFDQWYPDEGTDWGLTLIKHFADVCGVNREPDRGGRLWARLSTL